MSAALPETERKPARRHSYQPGGEPPAPLLPDETAHSDPPLPMQPLTAIARVAARDHAAALLGERRSYTCDATPSGANHALLERVYGRGVAAPAALVATIARLEGAHNITLDELVAVFCALGRDRAGRLPESELAALASGRRFCSMMHARAPLRVALTQIDTVCSPSSVSASAMDFQQFCDNVLRIGQRDGDSSPGAVAAAPGRFCSLNTPPEPQGGIGGAVSGGAALSAGCAPSTGQPSTIHTQVFLSRV